MILVFKYLSGVGVAKYAVDGVPVQSEYQTFYLDLRPLPGANDGVGSPAEDEECDMDDGHFESFQHRFLGKAHRGLFRSRLAIFIVDKEMVVALTSLSSLNLSASPGEQRAVLTFDINVSTTIKGEGLIINTFDETSLSVRRTAIDEICL